MNQIRMPIDEVIPEIKQHLEHSGAAVLIAEPGAGKTTRTPLELLQTPWMADMGMILLEPRRMAARSAAVYMAAQLGEPVGETVGYRIRSESKTSSRTRITVVTEGILTRLLQHDPALTGIGLILFDEFHERSIHADLGLALTLQSRELLRDDLRVLVMSATLDAEPVAALLGGAPIVESRGVMYPVETIYAGRPSQEPLEAAVARTVQRALAEREGSVLVFLPGANEIRRAQAALAGGVLPAGVEVAPLYGALPQQEQQRALDEAAAGGRKVVLATSIAETSLTVPGITAVIDCGLRRTALFSPRTGMSRLVTVPAARDSADQRRGRAGRTAPGVCYRLWSEAEDRALSPATPPEILEADLTPLALELAAWGASGPDELAWLDPPPEAPYGQAIQLLGQLGALDQAGRLTAHGRRMAGLGLHPRLAQMLLRAWPLGLARPACLLAGLLEAPGALKGGADLRDHLAVLMTARSGRKPKGGASSLIADEGALRRIDLVSKQWERLLADQFSSEAAPAPEADWERYCGLLVSFAYPDRMGKRRSDGRYLLRSGRGAAFHRNDPLAAESYLAIADVDDRGIESRIWLAAPFEESWFSKFYHNEMTENRTAEWDEQAGAVRARKTLTLDALVLKEIPDPNPDPGLIQQALIRVITEQGAQVLPWNPKARQLQSRILFLRELDAKWPDVSDEALAEQAEEWFLPYISDMKKKRDLQSLPMLTILETRLGWELCRELDREAPSHLPVPSGSKVQLQYDSQGNPFAAVRLQEVFGMLDTPRIGYGTVPVVLHLLSPASRPVQVTSDLANFWQHTYFEVKKDLKGRYPKHYWPDDPWTAQATRKVRPDGAR